MNNELLSCNLETGSCFGTETPAPPALLPVQVTYFTDPICSTCWGIEPPLRRLKLEYGHGLAIQYRMGGLLPDWNYNKDGISRPADVAAHWDEASLWYGMPIDGDVWLEDPLPSSFPPSVAFKAAELQDAAKAVAFLRILREMVFVRKIYITRREYIDAAAQQAGLDADRLANDLDGEAQLQFRLDLALRRELGVTEFPTFFFRAADGQRETVAGFRPYEAFEAALTRLAPTLAKKPVVRDWESLFAAYPSWTTREWAEVTGQPTEEAGRQLRALAEAGNLRRLDTKNGTLWTRPQGR